MVREVSSELIAQCVYDLVLKASYFIGDDVKSAISTAVNTEITDTVKNVLTQLSQNYEIAASEKIAICQDCGMCVIFADIGQDVHISGEYFETAVNFAVERAYNDGHLRKSIVFDPVYDRKNTGTNTPCVLHTRIVPGNKIHLLVILKGFGSENMSKVEMLAPADGENGIIDFVVDTAVSAGPNPCPPIIVGVGIGGSFEQAAINAKLMTARRVGSHNADPRYADLEEKYLTKSTYPE